MVAFNGVVELTRLVQIMILLKSDVLSDGYNLIKFIP